MLMFYPPFYGFIITHFRLFVNLFVVYFLLFFYIFY
nr:MAG TPA: hypothetical protein [Caudoviricetes sp.]